LEKKQHNTTLLKAILRISEVTLDKGLIAKKVKWFLNWILFRYHWYFKTFFCCIFKYIYYIYYITMHLTFYLLWSC